MVLKELKNEEYTTLFTLSMITMRSVSYKFLLVRNPRTLLETKMESSTIKLYY